MIDKKEFENNFLAHHKDRLEKSGIDVVMLNTIDPTKCRAVEFLTQPLDEEKMPLGYLRSNMIAEKYGVSISVENFGRGEGETILKRSFSVKIDEYNENQEEEVIDLTKKLILAVNDFNNS